jgi:hypothetical protein
MTLDPDRLDELLEKEPYLDDGGFTARVMAELPPPRRDLRPWVKGLSAAAAGVTAVLVLPGLVQAGLAALATVSLPAALAPGLVVGLAAAVGAGAVVGLVLTLEA